MVPHLQLNTYLSFYDSPQSAQWAGLLKFVSEKDQPGVFKSDQGETHRVAMTGLQKFSVVYINTDRMTMPLEQMVGILAHETVHHLGYSDDSKRLPDRVGAAIATHFQKRIQLSTLEQYNLPDARNLIFNSVVSNRLSVGFFSFAASTYDIEWGQSPLVQFCQGNEQPTRQFVGNIVWKVNRLRIEAGIVTVRGAGFVNVMCTNPSTKQDRRVNALINAGIDLQYAAPLDIHNWSGQTPTVRPQLAEIGPSMSTPDVIWGPNQSFVTTSLQYEKPSLVAGDTWKARLILQSVDGYKPQTCEVYFSATKWSYWKHINLPAPAIFDSCQMTALPNNQWQIDTQFKLPADMQPDDFYIYLVRFPDQAGDRYAVPSKPTFLRVENAQAKPAATFDSLKITGLSPLDKFAGDALKNSFQANENQSFQIQAFIKGDQVLSQVLTDITFSVPFNGDLATVFFNGPVQQMPDFFRKVEMTRQNGGTLVTITLQMAPTLAGYPIAAIKIGRISLQTSDFSWVELENLDLNEYVIVNKKHLQ